MNSIKTFFTNPVLTNEVKAFFTNSVLMCAVLGWCIAQVLKVFTTMWKEKKIDLRMALASGGMPSSHSACVCAMATQCGLTYGFGSAIFAVSAVFSMIVMYDAAGVRRAAGEQAKRINQITEEMINSDAESMPDQLKELIGHTPLQVLVGAIIGIIIPYVFSPLFK